MGDAEGNQFVPFQITYLPQNTSEMVDGYTPLNPQVVPCNASVDVSEHDSNVSKLPLRFVFSTGSHASVFLRRLCSIVPKAAST
jgi:hypothetical protein